MVKVAILLVLVVGIAGLFFLSHLIEKRIAAASLRRNALDRGYSETLREAGVRFDLDDLAYINSDPPETQYPSALDAACDDEPPAAFRMNRERRGSWPAQIHGGNAHQRRVLRRFIERGCAA